MKYPDDFDTSTFPAGKQIAVTRTVGIAVMVVFLLIIFACGLLLWAQKSAHIHPFLVSINNITGRWEIVGHHHNDIKEIPTTQLLQESVIGNFLEYRFLITNDDAFNSRVWQVCDRNTNCSTENKNPTTPETCALFCLSGDDAHTTFITKLVPYYQERFLMGEILVPNMTSVKMFPVGQITDTGGTWQIRMNIQSSMVGNIEILAYANIARNLDMYPKTLGYYVADFNAYKIN